MPVTPGDQVDGRVAIAAGGDEIAATATVTTAIRTRTDLDGTATISLLLARDDVVGDGRRQAEVLHRHDCPC
jgi:hypothetical protein